MKLAYVLGNYPGRVETFVFNEMRGLERLGFEIYVCPIHYRAANGNGVDTFKTIYAEYFNLPWIIGSHIYYLISRPLAYLKCLLRYKSLGGKLVFWKSAFFAKEIQKHGIVHVHAHFGWTAADAARVVSRLTGIPFSFTVHAADIYFVPDDLGAKLKEAKFVITCVKNNKKYISRIFGEATGRKVEVVYHGVDLEVFKPMPDMEKSVDILCIGNFVEKKGHRYLIEACDILKRKGFSFTCLIIGEGPEKEQIVGMIRERDMEGCVRIEGKRPQADLPTVYAAIKIFVLPSIITEAGDRDGIPNVLAEAMAMGLPVISSNLPNISELIEHNKDGILVKEKDPEALTRAIEDFLEDHKKYRAISEMGRKKIENEFDARDHIQKIAEIFLHN